MTATVVTTSAAKSKKKNSCSPHSSIQVIPNNFSTSEHADISRLQATHGARRNIVILSPTVIQMLVATATCQQNFGRPVTDINSATALRLNTSFALTFCGRFLAGSCYGEESGGFALQSANQRRNGCAPIEHKSKTLTPSN